MDKQRYKRQILIRTEDDLTFIETPGLIDKQNWRLLEKQLIGMSVIYNGQIGNGQIGTIKKVGLAYGNIPYADVEWEAEACGQISRICLKSLIRADGVGEVEPPPMSIRIRRNFERDREVYRAANG